MKIKGLGLENSEYSKELRKLVSEYTTSVGVLIFTHCIMPNIYYPLTEALKSELLATGVTQEEINLLQSLYEEMKN